MADVFLRQLTAKAEEYCDFIAREVLVMRQQTTPSQLMQRIGNKNGLTPGYESVWENRKGVGGLRVCKAGLADLLTAIEDEGEEGIVVYNVRVFPREYVVEMVSANLKRRLKALVFEGGALQKPAVMLSRWRDAVRAFQVVERELSFSLSDVARDVLLQGVHHGGRRAAWTRRTTGPPSPPSPPGTAHCSRESCPSSASSTRRCTPPSSPVPASRHRRTTRSSSSRTSSGTPTLSTTPPSCRSSAPPASASSSPR